MKKPTYKYMTVETRKGIYNLLLQIKSKIFQWHPPVLLSRRCRDSCVSSSVLSRSCVNFGKGKAICILIFPDPQQSWHSSSCKIIDTS